MSNVLRKKSTLTRQEFLKLSGAGVAGLVVLGSAGCGGSGSSSGQAELQFTNWISAEEASRANMETLIETYQQENQNTSIENSSVPYSEMRQQLLTMASGGNPPDITMVEGPWSHELGAQGALIDFNEFVDGEYLTDNWEGALEAGRYEGKLYALPMSLTPFGLWYNKDLMRQAGLNPDEPPKTVDELNQQMDQIKQNLGDQDIYPIAHDITKEDFALTVFWPWLFAFNARPLYDATANFDTPEMGNVLQWLRDQATNEYTPVGQNNKVLRELLANGQAVFKVDGPYNVGILRGLNPELEGDTFFDTFGVTTIPVGENNGSETLALAHQLSIFAQSGNQDAAWDFANFLVSSETAIDEHHVPYGVIPALKSDQNGLLDDEFSDPVHQAYVNEILPTMVAGPFGPEYSRAGEAIVQAMERTAITDEPIDQILQQTEQDLQAIYER
jgi:multiple sugar transport system substrate-binding protein